MARSTTLDDLDRRIIKALDSDPRLPTAALAEKLGLARRTVQLRLARLVERGVYRDHSTRINPKAIGFQQHAYVSADVDQASLRKAVAALAGIPEVLRVVAVAGEWDVVCEVVAQDSEALFDVGQSILSCPGIRRASTAIVLRDLVPYRTIGLLRQPG